MRVTVRLFARLREITGSDRLTRDVPDGSSLKDVWTGLVREWPGLAPFESTVSGAINEEYARMSRTVADGDEVAFLPPVSGG